MISNSTNIYMWSTLIISELFFISLGILFYFIRKTRKLNKIIKSYSRPDEKKIQVLSSNERNREAAMEPSEQTEEFMGKLKEAFSQLDGKFPDSEQLYSIKEIATCNDLMNETVEELRQLNVIFSENIEVLDNIQVKTPELQKTIGIIRKTFHNFQNKIEELSQLGIKQKRELSLTLQEKNLSMEDLQLEKMQADLRNETLFEIMKRLRREAHVLKVQLTQKEIALKDATRLAEKLQKTKEENIRFQKELAMVKKMKSLDMAGTDQKSKGVGLGKKILEVVTQCVGVGINVISWDYRILWVNQVVKRNFGDVEGELCYRAFHKSAAACDECGARQIIQTGKNLVMTEKLLTENNGDKVWVELISTPFKDEEGKVVAILEVAVPINERKQAEATLRENEEKYRTLFEQSRDAIYITSKSGEFIAANQSTIDLFGYTREEMLHQNVLRIYSDPADMVKFQREIEKKGSVRDYEIKFRKSGGAEIDCLLTSTVRKDKEGNIIGYQGIFRDITEQKRTAQQLSEGEEKYRVLFEQSRDAIYITSQSGELIDVNPSGLALLGYGKEELTKLDLVNIYAKPEDRQRLRQELEKRGFLKDYYVRLRKKNGMEIDCLFTSSVRRGADGGILWHQGIIREIAGKNWTEDSMEVRNNRGRKYFEEVPAEDVRAAH